MENEIYFGVELQGNMIPAGYYTVSAHGEDVHYLFQGGAELDSDYDSLPPFTYWHDAVEVGDATIVAPC